MNRSRSQISHFITTRTNAKLHLQKSTIPTYAKIYEYMEKHPEVMVHSYEEGVHRVRSSNGNYALLIESLKNDYINEREPCDTMKVGQNLDSQGFGIGTPLGSPLR